jgi:hypothetical protein
MWSWRLETFGTIPLGLMSDPGNQTYFTIENTFSNLNFYEFVSDQCDFAMGT